MKRMLTTVLALAIGLVSVRVLSAKSEGPQLTMQERLQKEVRHELLMLPFYGVFDNFEYKIEGGKVILLGQVCSPTLKTQAERVVKTIQGVDSVDNRIEVLPVSPNDDRIRRAMYRAIYHNDTLMPYALRAVPPIHIIVKNGDVTLEGHVATQLDKTVAGVQASSVPGVFSVKNNLRAEK